MSANTGLQSMNFNEVLHDDDDDDDDDYYYYY